MFSGHEKDDTSDTQGVALMLHKTTQRAHTGWEAHRSRHIKVAFQCKKQENSMNVIHCYTPTKDRNENMKGNSI